jgi:hypothetical protein
MFFGLGRGEAIFALRTFSGTAGESDFAVQGYNFTVAHLPGDHLSLTRAPSSM